MQVKMKAEHREASGKGPARQLRMHGRVPGIVYGHGEHPVPISVDSKELFHVLHTEAGANVLVDVKLDGDTILAMPREVQRDAIRGRFIHVDFLRVARDETITVEVPIHLVGEAPGVKVGGVLEHHLWNVSVETLPQNVPSAIEADISSLDMNEALHVKDIRVPGNVTMLTPEDEIVVSVVPPQVLRVEEEVAEEAGVEAGEEAATPAAAEGEGSPVERESVEESGGEQAGE